MSKSQKTAQEIFDQWAQDYHADGMERNHRESVEKAFRLIHPSTGNYLEIGFGNGYGIEVLATNQYKNGKCYGLDVSSKMVSHSRDRLKHLTNVSIETGDYLHWTPPAPLRFSIIFSMEVFYYFKNIQAGIDKSFSLLEPDGMLMVLVNYYLENEWSHSWPEVLNVPMTLWSVEQYIQGFNLAGFHSIQQLYFDNTIEKMRTLCVMGKKL